MVNHHRLSLVNKEEDIRRRNASSWLRYGCHCGSVRWRTSSTTTSGSLFSFLLLLVSVEALSLASVTTATRMHYIHWNTTNPIFRIDNTDHIIDVNKNNIPFEYDQVNIICPVYTPGTHEDDAEKYIIYNVSKEEYDTCRITNPNPRIIAVCDKPYKLMYFTITFRSFTPQPGGLEFRPGQDYYFISTSSRDDLHRRIGGRCSSHNMKVVFKVCCKAEDLDKGTASVMMGRPALSSSTTTTTMASVTSTHGPVVILASNNKTQVISSSGVTLPPLPAPAVIPAVRTTTTSSPSTTTLGTPQLILPSVTAPPPQQRIPPHWKDMADGIPSFNVRTTTKKYGKYDFDKLSNEVVKNEELTSKSSGALQRHSSSSALVILFSAAITLFYRVR